MTKFGPTRASLPLVSRVCESRIQVVTLLERERDSPLVEQWAIRSLRSPQHNIQQHLLRRRPPARRSSVVSFVSHFPFQFATSSHSATHKRSNLSSFRMWTWPFVRYGTTNTPDDESRTHTTYIAITQPLLPTHPCKQATKAPQTTQRDDDSRHGTGYLPNFR